MHAVVLADAERCIGCRACEIACTGCKACLAACPVGAMDMLPLASLPGRKVAGKCDLCAGRPAGPACLAVCPAEALFLHDPKALGQLCVARRRRAALACAGSAAGSAP